MFYILSIGLVVIEYHTHRLSLLSPACPSVFCCFDAKEQINVVVFNGPSFLELNYEHFLV